MYTPSQNKPDTKHRKIIWSLIGGFIAFFCLFEQAFAAATLLPPGEQCFQATSPSSGGLYGPITLLGAISGGSGYVSNTYTNVPLTGGSGFGAAATITVTSGAVSGISITNAGSHYTTTDTLSASAASLGGSGAGFSVPVNTVSTTGTGLIGLLGTITPGSAGTSGVYAGVPLTGGSGSGATANITVSGGGVTAVAIVDPGIQYQVGDTLSAAAGNIGGTGGFSVPVSSVTINSALAGGQVYFYIPNTLTFKQTWKDSAQTIQNTNPVILDQNGCAIVYGTGSYRQVLQDSLGNTVWDQITTDTSAQQNVFWAGNAGGTPNGIIITDPGFNGTDGSIINFFSVFTNTGATTISIAASAYTNIPVVKDTTGGPVSLTGGEIVGTSPANAVSVIYSALQNNFHLMNTAIQSASGANAPLCGASGLKITNGLSPNNLIAVTANQIVMQSASGLTINRSNVTLSGINITIGTSISTANGMDGESPGTENWLYVWAIDNGAAPAGLVSSASGNGLSPTLPSGYTYMCRLGAMQVDGSSDLFHTLQKGTDSQWVVTTGSNTPNLPGMIGGFGTFPHAQSVSLFVPATATEIATVLSAELATTSGAGTASVSVSPNADYAATGSATNAPPCGFILNTSSAITLDYNAVCHMLLESTNVYVGQAISGSGSVNFSVLYAFGWKDSVNAN